MTWRAASCLLLLSLLVAVPQASAQINDARVFSAAYGFADASEPEVMTILSGEMDATVRDTESPFAFFDTKGLRIEGLEEVCWGDVNGGGGDCVEADDLRVVVHDGGGAGLKFPLDVSGSFHAAHALGLFMRFEGEDVNSLNLEQGLMAPSVEGEMTFDSIGRIGDISFGIAGFTTPPGTLAPASDDTIIDIIRAADGDLIERLQGKDLLVYFSGVPSIPVFQSDFAILPFEDLSQTRFTAATAGAAKQGLDFTRITELFTSLEQSNRQDQPDQGQGNVTQGSGAVEQILSEVLNGALVRFRQGENVTEAEVRQDFAIVLFDALVVENRGGGLEWTGHAAMQYVEGDVNGAQPLLGFWLLQLPWWGYLLWALAIGVLVARAVLKPPKQHDVWDKYQWIGWAAGAVLFLIVAFLWDLEMRSVWGTSVLTTSASGTAFWVTFGVQLGTMAFVLGVVAAPLSIITKNSLMLAKQGTFMRLGGPVAFLLSYLIGATLLLSYLDLILDVIVENMSA